ncbi:hypothetical protein NDU88_005121 [Pleurodeles waltl]|uniref:Uncharacterized protein n=1 Tax=Pleurodeles waltl TaxID=8319 RepID=A0AAV7NLK8_PLEWA|nr:hypothetical protein NDU88_005121 [Pleurodeles waltl]
MPNDKTVRKHTHQLLFSEAISQPRPMPSPAATAAPGTEASANEAHLDSTTERILQEIAAVSRHLEAMDLKITDLSTASHSIRSDIARFHIKVTNLHHSLTEVEGQLAELPEHDSELQRLHAKLTDMKDRSRRDNVCFFGRLGRKEGTDVRAFL